MLLQKMSKKLLPFSESFSSSTTKDIFTVNTHCCMTFQHVLYGTKNKERCHPQTTASLQLQMSSKIFIKGYQPLRLPPTVNFFDDEDVTSQLQPLKSK